MEDTLLPIGEVPREHAQHDEGDTGSSSIDCSVKKALGDFKNFFFKAQCPVAIYVALLRNPPNRKEHETAVAIVTKVGGGHLTSFLTGDNLGKLHVAFNSVVELEAASFADRLASNRLNVNVVTVEPTIIFCIEIYLSSFEATPFIITIEVRKTNKAGCVSNRFEGDHTVRTGVTLIVKVLELIERAAAALVECGRRGLVTIRTGPETTRVVVRLVFFARRPLNIVSAQIRVTTGPTRAPCSGTRPVSDSSERSAMPISRSPVRRRKSSMSMR